MRRTDAIARSYMSVIVVNVVKGHKKRCVKKTSALYMLIARVPCNVSIPPTTKLPMKPNKMPMRTSGMYAALTRLAR